MASVFLQFAERVLAEEKRPLTPTEIWEIARDRHGAPSSGQTPEATMGSLLYIDIRDNPATIFVKDGERPTKFRLRSIIHKSPDLVLPPTTTTNREVSQMDFIEKLQAILAKIQKQRDLIQTEEATKTAFVMPFISALGYDVFDPTEVVPEFTADVGIKKGEKVDYAIMRDGKVIMLFECKPCNSQLNDSHASQLYRYFSVTEARIAVLTDGVIYRFFTDIEEPNKMDSKPFMEFNMLDIQDHLVAELRRMSKQSFNIDEILTIAGELKYTREIKRVLSEQLTSPSEDFVRFLAGKIYNGKFTQSFRTQFADTAKKAFIQFIDEQLNSRLRSAIRPIQSIPEDTPLEANGSGTGRGGVIIETTEEELHAFYIVKAILSMVVDPNRIVHRDTQSYFGVLLDDNNRKPICRLYFNRKQKILGLFKTDKQEDRFPIENVNDIFKIADQLKSTLALYEPMPPELEDSNHETI